MYFRAGFLALPLIALGASARVILEINEVPGSNDLEVAINEVPDAGARFSKAKAFGDPCAPYQCGRTYTVVSGDTCVTIAARLGCSGPENIFYCNPQVKPDCSNLYPGETLRWW